MTSAQKVNAAEKLVFVAKQMGFNPRVIYRDSYNPTWGYTSMEELFEDRDTGQELDMTLSIDLGVTVQAARMEINDDETAILFSI